MKTSPAKTVFVWAVTIALFLLELWFVRYMLVPLAIRMGWIYLSALPTLAVVLLLVTLEDWRTKRTGAGQG